MVTRPSWRAGPGRPAADGAENCLNLASVYSPVCADMLDVSVSRSVGTSIPVLRHGANVEWPPVGMLDGVDAGLRRARRRHRWRVRGDFTLWRFADPRSRQLGVGEAARWACCWSRS
jgi:hypothetical protein